MRMMCCGKRENGRRTDLEVDIQRKRKVKCRRKGTRKINQWQHLKVFSNIHEAT